MHNKILLQSLSEVYSALSPKKVEWKIIKINLHPFNFLTGMVLHGEPPRCDVSRCGACGQMMHGRVAGSC